MAKKITISELVIKVGADVKEATKSLKQIDKLSQQVGKNQGKLKEKQERQEKQNDKEAQTRLRHQERMQLASHRAKLKQEDILLREKLKNGERIRRQELANHRKAVREQQQREKEANRSKNANRRSGGGSRGGPRGGGASVGAIAGGALLGGAGLAAIGAATAALATAATTLFTMSKERTMTREQVSSGLYAEYRSKGKTEDEADTLRDRDMVIIEKISNDLGQSVGNVGKTYQTLTARGQTPEQAKELTELYYKEMKGAGASDEATKATNRELKALFAGTGIDAESVNSLEEHGTLSVLASALDMTQQQLAKMAKDGKLNEYTQKVTPEQIAANLKKNGKAQYMEEAKAENPVTKASQELDSAINRLKDTFAKHSSGGVATALNALADVLGKKETQEMIIKAGETFGKILTSINEGLTAFGNSKVWETMKKSFNLQMDIIGAVIGALIKVLEPLAPIVETLFEYLGKVLDWVRSKLNPFLGEDEPKEEDKKGEPKEGKKNSSDGSLEPNSKGKPTDEVLGPKAAPVYDPATGNVTSDTMDSVRIAAVQENLKASAELANPVAAVAAPTSNSTTNDNRSNVVNNVSVNTTVNGDVGTDKAVTTIKEASNQASFYALSMS